MKKVLHINIGGISFTIEEDAYYKLKDYLDNFEATFTNKTEAAEVMEDIEIRIAEIFHETVKNDYQVVNIKLVEDVINRMGKPEGDRVKPEQTPDFGSAKKRLYRNPDDDMLAGICGGLAAYFGIDSSLIRIATLVLVIFGGLSIWIYIVLWIVVPRATTVAQKLEMRGIPVTAENIRNYSAQYK